MYRVLIVDDEPEIRQGLRLKADWESLGLTVAGEAESGAEALERLSEQAYDIMLADMNMPVMDGVSLLEACREQYPNLRVIVITGYEDFHYAKAAVKNRARDYLLKPVARDELTAALAKAKRELDDERRNRDEQAAVRWRLSQYYKDLKEHFVVQLVKGAPIGDGEARERARLFQLESWEQAPVRFVTAGLRERSALGASAGERTPDKFRLPFEMICMEFAKVYGEPVETFRDGHYPGLMHAVVREDGGADAAERFAESLSGCVKEQLAFEPAIGVSGRVTGFSAWKEGYLESLTAWNLSESEVAGKREAAAGRAVLSEDEIKVLRRHLARGEWEPFERSARAALEAAFGDSRASFVRLIFQLYFLLDAAAQELGVALDERERLWLRPDLVLSLDTAAKAETFLFGLGSRIRRSAEGGESDPEQSTIREVRRFIDDNYMYDLNLTALAERFNYNASYFSELFKAKVGKTFIQYLTDVRMKHAVRLLEETTLGLWDIAELSGFSNPGYFSSKFKRIYGVTPSEYRQRHPKKL